MFMMSGEVSTIRVLAVKPSGSSRWESITSTKRARRSRVGSSPMSSR